MKQRPIVRNLSLAAKVKMEVIAELLRGFRTTSKFYRRVRLSNASSRFIPVSAIRSRLMQRFLSVTLGFAGQIPKWVVVRLKPAPNF